MTSVFFRWMLSCGNKKAIPHDDVEYYSTPDADTWQIYRYDRLPPKAPNTVRLVCLSDTHEFHEKLKLPDGDVLIHCGDILVTDYWSPRWLSWWRVKKFFAWMNKHPHKHKIAIAGNHDLVFKRYGAAAVKKIAGVTQYLCDELVTIMGLNVYGTPRSQGKSWNDAFQDEATWAKKPPSGIPVTFSSLIKVRIGLAENLLLR